MHRKAEIVDLRFDLYGLKPRHIAIVLSGESVWFTMPGADAVGRIDHDGSIHSFALPSGSEPRGIVAAHGGVWLTLSGRGDLAHVASEGSVEVVSPVVLGDDDEGLIGPVASRPEFVTIAERGYLWFTRRDSADLARMDADRATESWTSPDCVVPSAIGRVERRHGYRIRWLRWMLVHRDLRSSRWSSMPTPN